MCSESDPSNESPFKWGCEIEASSANVGRSVRQDVTSVEELDLDDASLQSDGHGVGSIVRT